MFLKTNKIPFLILAISIVIIALLQLHNGAYHPITRGFDATGHIDYIHYLQDYMRVPLPNEGWELYQPPLYYVVATIIGNLRLVKIVGVFAWTVLLLTSYTFFKKVIRDTFIAVAGVCIVSFLPVVLYLTPSISNEFFSAVFISIAMAYYVLHRKLSSLKEQSLLGILLGLSLLAKSTAIILVVAIIVDQLITNRKEITSLLKKSIPVVIFFLLISGWFYGRNFYLFHNPIVASFNFPDKYPLHQTVIARDLNFFFGLVGFINVDMFQAQHYSFLAGTYFSWFYDGHNIIVPVQEFSKIGMMLVFLSLPIFFLFVYGSIKSLYRHNEISRFLGLYMVILFVGYILYNLRLPYYSTVKGSFLVSAVIPFCYFVLQGILPYRKHRFIISLYILLYCLVIMKTFWILPNWYQ
ncbi:MAG: glycosyltransferase family 39 protein [bacterium]|nr:glycosyltransferase family 39 protein [bacterium]